MNVRAHIDLAREFANENLSGLVLEIRTLNDGKGRGPLLDQLIHLLADFGNQRQQLAMNIVRDAAFEFVLDHSP